MNPRKRALNLLLRVLNDHESLSTVLAKDEDPLTKFLCFGVLRHYWELKEFVWGLLHKPLDKKNRDIFVLMQLGIFQLLYSRAPAHAVVKETVNAIPFQKQSWAKGLVNGCLRQFLREKSTLTASNQQEAHWNHPEWFIDLVKSQWQDAYESILHENNQHPPMVLRVNPLKTTREDYLEVLRRANIEARAIELTPYGIQLAEPCDVKALPHFFEGHASVQDTASQWIPVLFPCGENDRVLDACSAPGGKASALLERYPHLQLTAVDIDGDRLDQVRENFDRLGLKAAVKRGDATGRRWWDETPYDCILVDAPCSATGVIRRHPDIKVLRRESDIPVLAQTQGDILANLWSMLKSGGRLLYTTCSILREENDHVIQQFLATREDAKVVPLSLPIGQETPYGWQLLPSSEADGFYYACLVKQ